MASRVKKSASQRVDFLATNTQSVSHTGVMAEARRKRRGKADGGLTGAALAYLATQRDVWAERQNAGFLPVAATEKHERWCIRLGTPGRLDIRGYLLAPWQRTAAPFEIETKRVGKPLRESQKKYVANLDNLGVPWTRAESLTDVKRFLEELRRRT